MSENQNGGFTPTEKILTELSTKTFLNLWSWNNPFYKPNKELCDLIVICDNNIILFSDKEKKFHLQVDEKIAWDRWYRKAITDSIKQLKGAQRRIKQHPNVIYQDACCAKLLPIKVSDINTAKIHLIVVANGAAAKCKEYFGDNSNGSLMYHSDNNGLSLLFTIGDENPEGTFVHILDSFTLPILLNELNTISDLVQYLNEKEIFLRSGKLIMYPGEEELLAYYLKNYDIDSGKHCFFNKENISADIITLTEGMWSSLKEHPQYIAKKEADKASYLWDDLINQFIKHMLAGTSTREGAPLDLHEGGVRYMALESRIHRRILAKALMEIFNSYQPTKMGVKISTFLSLTLTNTTYIIVQFPFTTAYENYQDYQQQRLHYLRACCFAAKAKFSNFTRVIGIAMEPPCCFDKPTSESMVLLDCSPSSWTQEMQDEGEFLSKEFHIFQSENMTGHAISEKNFPDI